MRSDTGCFPQHAHAHTCHTQLEPSLLLFFFFLVKVRWFYICLCVCLSVCICLCFHVSLSPLYCYCLFVKLPIILWLDVCPSSLPSPSLKACALVLVSVTTSQPVSLTHCFSYWPCLVSDVSGFWAGFHDSVPSLSHERAFRPPNHTFGDLFWDLLRKQSDPEYLLGTCRR